MSNRLLLVLTIGLLVLLGAAACSPVGSTGAAPVTAPASLVTTGPAASILVPSAKVTAPSAVVPAPSSAPLVATPTAPPSVEDATLAILPAAVVGTPTSDTRPDPKYWSSWPVIPTVSAAARQIYEHGLALGNNPHVFSTIGDCQSEPNVFMGVFESDQSPLGPKDTNLRQTVLYFAGSFSRKSLAVHDGLSPASALSPLWADHSACQADENPVACELRLRKPSIMFINLGTVWKKGASAAPYETYLRQIVDLLIAHGTLPILATKADNVEGDHSLDLATARVAHDYDIPLWNFWLASDTLPNHGLDPGRDNVYLAPLAWGPRNYSALQVLDSVWRSLDPSAASTLAAEVTSTAVPVVTTEGIAPAATALSTTTP